MQVQKQSRGHSRTEQMNRVLPVLCLLVGVLLGCSGGLPLSDSSSDTSPDHTLIYVIHGDGDYLYHENGIERQADQQALAEARLVAAHAPRTEVFIFHQRSSRDFLGLFSRPDGTFYHYRDGTLIARHTYRRSPGDTSFTEEAALYHDRRQAEGSNRTLLYYGHQVAEESRTGYHASYSKKSFGLDELVEGLEAFGGSENPFGLVVLSTCNNGTPGTVAALAPLTRYLLASPGNLHLSYIDSHPLHRVATAERGIEDVAPQLAEWAFNRLDERTETAVTLTLYDTEALGPGLDDLASSYERARAHHFADQEPLRVGFVDCRERLLPKVRFPASGVRTWYQAPSFGPQSQKDAHSGWGCPRPKEALSTADY